MKAVLMSVNKPHTDNIHSGAKTSELRTSFPRIPTPFKVYMYETKRNGGCGKVVSEWICKDITQWLMYMGLPAHLSKVACVSDEYILKYCKDGQKNITELEIDQTSVKVYEQAKELSDFWSADKCLYASEDGCTYKFHCFRSGQTKRCGSTLTRPPQSWRYVKEVAF